MRRTPGFPGLTAGDVMRPAAVVLPHEMGMAKAAVLLRNGQAGTASVTDAEGRCVGTLSSENILRWAAAVAATGGRTRECGDGVWCDWQLMGSATARGDEVRAYMTRDPVCVNAGARLLDFADTLLEGRRPIVVVVDAARRPLGLILPADVLKVVTAAPCPPPGRLPAAASGTERQNAGLTLRQQPSRACTGKRTVGSNSSFVSARERVATGRETT